MRKLIPTFLLLAFLILPVYGDALRQAGQAYSSGNAKYRDKDYAGALEDYRQAFGFGARDADLYYNMGCAYFRTGDYGRALLNFERAARVKPRDPDIATNLEEAARYTIDKIDPLYNNFLMRYQHGILFYLSIGEWLWLLTALFTLTVIGFISQVWLAGQPRMVWLRWIWRVGLPLFILCAILLGLRLRDPVERNRAVIVESKVDVTAGPSVPEVSMTLHTGTRVMVEESRESFCRVRLDDGRTGWIPVSAVEKVRP